MQRVSSLAGTWYPNDADKLRAVFATWQEKALLKCDAAQALSVPSVIIVPHAGYEYSGELAAAVFSRLDPEAYDRVIILAPSHHAHFFEMLSAEPIGEVITPLGAIHFDSATHEILANLPHVGYMPEAHKGEHSIDILLPFIQYFLPHCASKGVGALLCGQWAWQGTTKGRIATFARALRAVCAPASQAVGSPRTLLIVSTDFTHYGPRFGYTPFEEDIEERLRVLDQQVYTACTTNDGELFEFLMDRVKATVCGRTPLHCVLAMLPEGSRWEQVAYTTSGALTGDFTHSVSYIGAMVYADWTAPLQQWVLLALDEYAAEALLSMPELDAASKKALLTLARQSLEYAVKHGSVYPIDANALQPTLLESLPKALPEALYEDRAVFITLYKDGQLRGCIGELLPTRSLASAVAARTCDAALHDTRFPPVSEEELSAIHLEISVISPPVAVASYEAIELGRHGIILKKGQNSAVFLPHVPIEQGWDLPTTLKYLSQKAQLELMAWQAPDTTFFVFTSEIVTEA